jgi:hypothetical protein
MPSDLSVSVIFVMTFASFNARHGGLRICIACETFAEYVCFLKHFQKQYLRSVNVELDLVYAKTV